MRMTAQLPILALGALFALLGRAQAQSASDPNPSPFPYAPPPGFAAPNGSTAAMPQPEPQGPVLTEVPDVVPRPAPPRPASFQQSELPPVDASADEAGFAAEPYGSQAGADEGDLGADEAIADGYDDGYDPNASAEFEQSLSPYGSWVDDADYGEIWIPTVAIVGANFLPYFTNGHWVLSEYGWTWVSDWSWGWAPFHYGRWLQTARRGWCWIPGTTWGPAWVSWRSGGGYVGWAPLPPRGVALAAAIPEGGAHSAWRFAPAPSLGGARAVGLPPNRVPGIFGRTSVVANDRLLTHGPYAVHINAGPLRGTAAAPARLAAVAPNVLPKSTILPRAGTSVAARPWSHVALLAPVSGTAGGTWGRGHAAPTSGAAGEGWGRGSVAPFAGRAVGGRAVEGRPATLDRPRAYAPFVSRSPSPAAAPAWQASSTPASGRPEPLLTRPAPTSGWYASPASRGYAAPAPEPRYAAPAPEPRYAAPAPPEPRYGSPSPLTARTTPAGEHYAPAPAHVEPRMAPTPPPPVHVEPAHGSPPEHWGGARPTFSPAPAPGFPAGGGSVGGGAPHHFGGPSPGHR